MRKFVFIVIALTFIVVLALPALHRRPHADKRAQAVWLWEEVQHLQNLGAPSLASATNRESGFWAKDGFLIFSNDWAAFSCHTFHDSEDIGDVALIRTSTGVFYVSYYHFCCGESTFDSEDRPKDFLQFLELFGARQNWTCGPVLNTALGPTAGGSAIGR
jgi:hypothetical protein